MTRIQTSNNLRLAFNFTNSDLQDNRQGFMSYRQKRWLRIKSFLKFDWLIGSIAVMAVPVVALTALLMFDLTFRVFSETESIVTKIFAIVVFGIIYGGGSVGITVLFGMGVYTAILATRHQSKVRSE